MQLIIPIQEKLGKRTKILKACIYRLLDQSTLLQNFEIDYYLPYSKKDNIIIKGNYYLNNAMMIAAVEIVDNKIEYGKLSNANDLLFNGSIYKTSFGNR